MKVFKKIIAGVIAGTLVLAIATSAFAASVSTNGVVTGDAGFNQTSGKMTVMVVNAAAYDANEVTANDICYIDQDTAANVIAKITSGMGSINLKHGDYYIVVGGAGAVQKSDKIATITVGEQYPTTSEQSGRNVIAWNVTVKAQLQSGLTAQLFNTSTEESTTPVELEWEEGIITGEGDVSFEVVTELKNPELAGSTELEITSGVVSDRN